VAGWTIDELAELAAEALAAAGVGVADGRVTPVPDRRLIRWYVTTGLLDRPLPARGRTARYGERHLLQLVAVKRRQAEGRPLAEIQAELAGATDATLRRIAALPRAATPARSWSPDARSGAQTDQDRRRDGRFWRDPTPARRTATGRTATGADAPAPAVRYTVALHPAVALTVPHHPDPADLAAIHAAARPLLDLLAARGLLTE
jgi:DNA-binding transcriptional MerR regulator